MKRFLDCFLGRDNASVDRRRSPRYRALPNRGLLSWRDDGQARRSRVQLLNVSGVGVLLATERRLDRGQAVWLRSEEPVPTEWIEATVVRRAGARKIALDFAEHCPYDL